MDFKKDNEKLFQNSALYQEFLAEREEILKHKWLESEKVGRDVGFEKALLDWIVNHRASWRQHRQTLLHQRESNSLFALFLASAALIGHQCAPLLS